jgi:hypothetical protein
VAAFTPLHRSSHNPPQNMSANRRVVGALGAIVLSLSLSACATVTRGTKQALVVESEPSGAMVEVDGQRGSTPTSFKLSRKFEGPVLITKQGYEPVTVNVTSQVSTGGGVGMAGNALIGGLIGAGVDVATGSTNELKPNPIFVTLVPIGAPAAPAPMGAMGGVAPVPPQPAAAPAVQTPYEPAQPAAAQPPAAPTP